MGMGLITPGDGMCSITKQHKASGLRIALFFSEQAASLLDCTDAVALLKAAIHWHSSVC